jgi:hypothetical protein
MIRACTKALTLLLIAHAAPVAAQSTPALNFSRELDELHRSVMALAFNSDEFQNDLADVARLHGAVAAMRAPGDPKRFACLMDQSALLAGVGQPEAARGTVAMAALEAERSGDWVDAANAWVTAVLLARGSGDLMAAEEHRQRAEWIATLPAVTGEESATIAAALYAEHWKTAALPPTD